MKIDHMSVTKINAVHRCGEQFRFRYIEGLRVPPGFALIRGTSVDHAVTVNLRHKRDEGTALDPAEVVQIARDQLDREIRGGYSLDGEYGDLGARAAKGRITDEVTALAELHALKLAPILKPERVQAKITLAPGRTFPWPFLGYIDLIEDGRIRDLKTSTKAPPALLAHNNIQLSAYDLLYRAHYGAAPRGLGLDYFWRTPGGERDFKVLPTERTIVDLKVFRDRALAAATMIEREVFLPAPVDSWVCTPRFCGYTDRCRFYAGRPRPTS